MNCDIKSKSRTGTTSVVLYTKLSDDGSIQLYCANTGDSRCVGRYNNSIIEMSQDHKLSLSREMKRIENHVPVEWKPLPTEFQLSVIKRYSVSSKRKFKVEAIRPEANRYEKARNLVELFKRCISSENRLSQSSILMNVLEAMSRSSGEYLPYLIPPIDDYDKKNRNNVIEEDLFEKKMHGDNYIVSLSSPSSYLTKADLFDNSTHSATEIDSLPAESNHNSSVHDPDSAMIVYDTDLDDDIEFITMPIKRQLSYVASRSNASGTVKGPLALFSRHDVSTTMTRSVGDRHAARTCVCTPDITKLTVRPQEYARFILASDGLWDVMSSSKAQSIVQNVINPADASRVLVRKVRMLRQEEGLRMDDITCVVVDINPKCNPSLRGKRLLPKCVVS
jgi:serine/threonine protein phosphatase PrpC